MENVLYKYYYDPKLGYQSADKLQKKLKVRDTILNYRI